MNQELYRIVYCSQNLIDSGSTECDQDHQLEQILSSARKNNIAEGVTGALLFNSGYFAQVLEGPRRSVESIFERIQRDRRHNQVTVVENGSTHQRDFPEWAMAHVQPSDDEDAVGIASKLKLALVQHSAHGSGVLDLLKDLVVQD